MKLISCHSAPAALVCSCSNCLFCLTPFWGNINMGGFRTIHYPLCISLFTNCMWHFWGIYKSSSHKTNSVAFNGWDTSVAPVDHWLRTVWLSFSFVVLSINGVSIEYGYKITLTGCKQPPGLVLQCHLHPILILPQQTVASFNAFKLPFHNSKLYVLHVIPSKNSVGEKHCNPFLSFFSTSML